MTSIEARLCATRGSFVLDVDLNLPAAGVTCLFGRSGAGKTTLLRTIAGLERGARGRLSVRGVVWQDDACHCFVPTHKRALGYVLQDAALFPHLDVRRNLEYGLRRVPRDQRRIGLDDVVDALGLAAFLARRPQGLSGGERQRVAIGRALLSSPSLLLLDEPLASLDEESRREVLPALAMVPRSLDVPTLLVTHSIREVARLGDRVVTMEAGRARELAEVSTWLTTLDPATADPDAIGAVLDATVVAHDDADQLTELSTAAGPFLVRRLDAPPGRTLRVHLPARDVSLALDAEPRSSILNVVTGHVLDLRDAGAGQVVVRVQCGGVDGPVIQARVTGRSARTLGLVLGTPVHARVKSVGLLE